MGVGRASPGMQGQLCLQEGFHTSPLPTLNPPPWYLLVSEIKLLLPLGHPLEGDPLLCPSLCRAEIDGGSRMVPVGAGGTPAAPPQGTMSHQPQHKFGGDLGTHLCSSAATTKPQDATSVQTEEYKVLEGRWEQRGQDRSEWGHRGPPTSLSQPCYRKAPRPWEKMIRGYPLLRGLKGPFQLTGTLQEPAGRRNPQERGDMSRGCCCCCWNRSLLSSSSACSIHPGTGGGLEPHQGGVPKESPPREGVPKERGAPRLGDVPPHRWRC